MVETEGLRHLGACRTKVRHAPRFVEPPRRSARPFNRPHDPSGVLDQRVHEEHPGQAIDQIAAIRPRGMSTVVGSPFVNFIRTGGQTGSIKRAAGTVRERTAPRHKISESASGTGGARQQFREGPCWPKIEV